MRTPEQWYRYKKLELISSSDFDLQTIRLTVLAIVRSGYRVCQDFLTLKAEPQIWQFQQEGKGCWKVYDPKADQTFELDTEQDVVVWLEERHRPRHASWNAQKW